jgi:hypothetical protein
VLIGACLANQRLPPMVFLSGWDLKSLPKHAVDPEKLYEINKTTYTKAITSMIGKGADLHGFACGWRL